MKLKSIAIALAMLTIAQGANANEGGDIHYPQSNSISTKTRAQVIAEYEYAKKENLLPPLGDNVVFVFTTTNGQSRAQVCEALAASTNNATRADLSVTY